MLSFSTPFPSTTVKQFTIPKTRCRHPPRASQKRLPTSENAAQNPSPQSKLGQVHLIGTGPSSVNHLTKGAVRKIQQASIILHDRLVSAEILSQANPSAKLISVAKGRGQGTGSQSAINQQLATYAKSGHTVARLKGGDPSIFGRLGSELEFLRRERIPVSVEAGVTTASALAARLGFPLTHAQVARGVCFVSAHEDVDWISGALLGHVTLVVYMGLHRLGDLLKRLSESGADGDVAAVAVHGVSTEDEQVVWGTIDTLHAKVLDAALSSPTIVVIGNVVRLACGWEGGS